MGLGRNREGYGMHKPLIKNIIFICTGNSCRSQMAEGWVRKLKGGILEPYSAGIEFVGTLSYAFPGVESYQCNL